MRLSINISVFLLILKFFFRLLCGSHWKEVVCVCVSVHISAKDSGRQTSDGGEGSLIVSSSRFYNAPRPCIIPQSRAIVLHKRPRKSAHTHALPQRGVCVHNCGTYLRTAMPIYPLVIDFRLWYLLPSRLAQYSWMDIYIEKKLQKSPTWQILPHFYYLFLVYGVCARSSSNPPMFPWYILCILLYCHFYQFKLLFRFCPLFSFLMWSLHFIPSARVSLFFSDACFMHYASFAAQRTSTRSLFMWR